MMTIQEQVREAAKGKIEELEYELQRKDEEIIGLNAVIDDINEQYNKLLKKLNENNLKEGAKKYEIE